MLAFQETQTAQLPTPQRLQKAHAHRSVPEPALLAPSIIQA